MGAGRQDSVDVLYGCADRSRAQVTGMGTPDFLKLQCR